jgi:hypothetical protein
MIDPAALKTLRRRAHGALQTPSGRLAVKMLSVAFSAGLILYLGRQLTEIGWARVLAYVPRTPWFYLAFAGFYFSSPLHEVLALKLLWGCPLSRSFPALMKKRVYSRQVLDYSGEAYLYLWARRHIDRPQRELAHTIKDNVIVSSTSSTLVAVVALLILLMCDQVALPPDMLQHGAIYVTAGAAGALAIMALVVKFRRRILWLPRRMILSLGAIHMARLVSMLLLELLMWTTVDATVPLRSWLSLLAVGLVITRIPFLPNRDLVLFGTGMTLAGAIRIPLPLMAGMLLMVSIMEKTLNLFFFGLFTLIPERASDVGEPAGGVGESSDGVYSRAD